MTLRSGKGARVNPLIGREAARATVDEVVRRAADGIASPPLERNVHIYTITTKRS